MSSDLVDYEDVSEEAILDFIKERYHNEKIYSSVGPIIISINPYRNIESLYTKEHMDLYKPSEDIESNIYYSTPAHLWSITRSSLQQIRMIKKNQSILISGESGAGKTEATKKCLQYISLMSLVYSPESKKGYSEAIEEKVLATNPILESFGNAKTARNNNSSRFGKWLEIEFEFESDNSMFLSGAKIIQYLLEKSRVIFQSPEERNYHIFYQICASGDSELNLEPASEYKYLNQVKNIAIDGIDDSVEYSLTLRSMQEIGIEDSEIKRIFSYLKAILLIGNIEFKPSGRKSDTTNESIINYEEKSSLLSTQISQILGLSEENFKSSIIKKMLKVRGEVTHIPLDAEQAHDSKNALAKEIYGRIFSHIIKLINQTLDIDQRSSKNLNDDYGGDSEMVDIKKVHSIGLLDIFGFEKFKFNSFEQLCINYANEKLQQFFINFVFKKEQELYHSESIDFQLVLEIENEDVLSLIEGRPNGIFAKLDDELKLPKGSDEAFLKKIDQEHNSKKVIKRFKKDIKMARHQFEIVHFAGTIRYDVKGFMEKNRDRLFDHLEDLLLSSTDKKFKQIIVENVPMKLIKSSKDSRSAGPPSMAGRFQNQLQRLMDTLNNSQPNFIKCIKPNNQKSPDSIDSALVLAQLNYSGVLEAIQIRKSGYPTRRSHRVFRQSYWMLSSEVNPKTLSQIDNERDKCKYILKYLVSLHPSFVDIRIGNNLIFMRPNILKELDKQKYEKGMLSVAFLQKQFRMRIKRKFYKKILEGKVILLQRHEEGLMYNSSNIEAIQPLEEQLIHCESKLTIPFHILQPSWDLLARLKRIKECLDRLNAFISQEGVYEDVFDEYKALKKLVSEAEELSIQHPELSKVYQRLDLLQERANCLEKLRISIGLGEQNMLEKYIREASDLIKMYGEFCEKDIKRAASLFENIKSDMKRINDVIHLMRDFQVNFKFPSKDSTTNSINTQDLISDREDLVLSLNKTLSDMLSPFEESVINGNFIKLTVNLIKLFKEAHNSWVKKDWEVFSQLINEIKFQAAQIDEYNQTLELPIGEVTDVLSLVHDEMSLFEEDILVHYLLPLLQNALSSGGVKGEPGEVNIESIDIQLLSDALEQMKPFSICGPLIEYLNFKFELLIRLRLLYLQNESDEIMIICDSEPNNQKRFLAKRGFEIHLLKISHPDEMADEQEEILEVELDTANLNLIKKYSPPNFQSIEVSNLLEDIESESQLIFQDSVEKDFIRLLLKALKLINSQESKTDGVSTENNDYDSGDQKEDILEEVKEQDVSKALKIDNQNIRLLELKHSIVAAILELSSKFLLGMENQISTSLSDILNKVNKLEELVQKAIHIDNKAIIQIWKSNQIIFSGNKISDTDLDLYGEDNGRLLSFNLLSNEMVKLIGNSFEAYAIDNIKNTFSIHRVKGNVGSLESSPANLDPLESLIQGIEVDLVKLENLGASFSMLRNYIAFSQSLIEIRKVIFSDNFTKKKQAFNSLKQNQLLLREISNELLDEIKLLETEVEYTECLAEIEAALYIEPPIKYLVHFSKTRKRTILSNRHKSTSFDSNTGSISVSSSYEDIDDILQEEELMINENALETIRFNGLIRKVQEFNGKLKTQGSTVPQKFIHYSSAFKLVKAMRDAVFKGAWNEGLNIYREIDKQNLGTLVPVIQDELMIAYESISNYSMISSCKTALVRGQPVGIIGQMDYKNISLEFIENTIELCKSIGCTSKRANALYKAVLIIYDLRRAQKNGDWGSIRSTLQKAEKEGIGTGLTSLCLGEINRSLIEKDNHDSILALKEAIKAEELVSKDSLLDINDQSVKELSEAFAKANTIPDDTRGLILKSLISLSEVVLKTRRAAIQKQWFVLESLFAVLKDSIESFQNELEKFDRVLLSKKSVSFRSSNYYRGTLLLNKQSLRHEDFSGNLPSDGQQSAGSSPSNSVSKSSSMSLLKSATWEEFTDITNTIKREIKAIDFHFKTLELEKRIITGLESGSVKAVDIGKIDKSEIETSELEDILKEKRSFDEANIHLPNYIRQLSNVAALILDIRKAILEDKWDIMNSLLEEIVSGDFGTIPEYSRNEIQVVRWEVENRWIISNLTKALMTGRLEGEFGKVDLGTVSCEHLLSYIMTSKSLNPRTPEAKQLLHTTESIYSIRKMIIATEKDWKGIFESSKNLIADAHTGSVHPSVIQELKLIYSTAEDSIVCEVLVKALKNGGPKGHPGNIDMSEIDYMELNEACNVAMNSSLKSDLANNLFTACRTIYSLREALYYAITNDTKEYWETVKAYLNYIDESIVSNPNDISWNYCNEEIGLVRGHYQVFTLKNDLINCIIETSQVYSFRNSINLSFDLPVEELNAPLKDQCVELDRIIDFARSLQFESEVLHKYVTCASLLRILRLLIIDANWDLLFKKIQEDSIRTNLGILKEAESELNWIKCECHNNSASSILRYAIMPSEKIQLKEFDETHENFPSRESLEENAQKLDYKEHNQILEEALSESKKFKITSVSARQLYECCSNLLLLRKSLISEESAGVSQALRWFKTNTFICPQYILLEAQNAYVTHQNNLLAASINKAFECGKPKFINRRLELAEVEIAPLKKLFDQSSQIEKLFPSVQSLVDDLKIVLKIRQSLYSNDYDSLDEVIDSCIDREINLKIIDEIALARIVLDDKKSINALETALRSFDGTEGKVIDFSFSDGRNPSPSSSLQLMPRKNASILQSFSRRRYSYANKNNANIDLETIDLESLERGIRIANDHGLHSWKSIRLFETVKLIHSLRKSMKLSDWERVEYYLEKSNFESLLGKQYDDMASKEIQAIRSQLEMRASIVDLSKSLKTGWANCSNGIVDTSTLHVRPLSHAIERAQRSLVELTQSDEEENDSVISNFDSIKTSLFDNTIVDEGPLGSKSHIHKQVILLIRSAKNVLEIRECIATGNFEMAGFLAEKCLNSGIHYSTQEEVRFYSKEINSALSNIKLFQSLRDGMLEGNIEKLERLILEAKESGIYSFNDLGIIRTLEKAESIYNSLLDTRNAMQNFHRVFNIKSLENILCNAMKLNMKEEDIQLANDRLDRIRHFEAIIQKETQKNYSFQLIDLNRLSTIINEAEKNNLLDHPMVKKAKRLLQLSPNAFFISKIAHSLLQKNKISLFLETIAIKKTYLSLPSSQSKYRLENYPLLRSPDDYCLRMNIKSEYLRTSMLYHTEQSIPTSLTRLSPPLAALSVLIFSSIIRGIERSVYTYNEILLKKLINLGRFCVPLRDEIFLQVTKQIRHNPEKPDCSRLWRLMTICLYHFPPSRRFENYLEHFFYSQLSQSNDDSLIIKKSILLLHQSIFFYGYQKVIPIYSGPTNPLSLWLERDEYYVVCPPEFQDPKSKVAEEDKKKSMDSPRLSLLSSSHETLSISFNLNDHILHSKIFFSDASSLPEPGLSVLRGIREDWIERFTNFNNRSTSKDGGFMNREEFARCLSVSSSESSQMDPFDKEIFYYLLFGKPLNNYMSISREFSSQSELFHFASEDERASSTARQQWLENSMPIHERSSELFFSQLKPSDLLHYAERFWDTVIEKMSRKCPSFPFFKWETNQLVQKSEKDLIEFQQGLVTLHLLSSESQETKDTKDTKDTKGTNIVFRSDEENLVESFPHINQNFQQFDPRLPPQSSSTDESPSSPLSPKSSNFVESNAENGSTAINWELYREILLVGMKKYLEQKKHNQKNQNSKSNGDDLKLYGFKMHSIE